MCCGRGAYYCFCVFFLLIILASFIFFVIFLPEEFKFTVTDASLEQFDLSSADNSTLSYNLALNITIRNPNRKVGVFFDRIQVFANYRKKRLALVTLNSTTPFYQGHKNTTVLPSVHLQGQQKLSLKESDLEKYNYERSLGIFSIDVKIALRVRARYGKIRTGHYKPSKIDCDKLEVPLLSSTNGASSSINFKAITCKNVFVITSRSPGH